jgi:hypothetical protein
LSIINIFDKSLLVKQKFNSDLDRVVISDKTLAKGSVEVKERTKAEAKLVKTSALTKLF